MPESTTLFYATRGKKPAVIQLHRCVINFNSTLYYSTLHLFLFTQRGNLCVCICTHMHISSPKQDPYTSLLG